MILANKYVSVNDFSGEVSKIFDVYSDEIVENVNEAVKEVAEDSKKELKVAGEFQNRSGKYRKGWRVSFNKLRYGIEAVVHNKVYPLTHLLESGHAKWLFGRDTGEEVRAFPHIEKVNEEAQKKLEEEILRRVNDI